MKIFDLVYDNVNILTLIINFTIFNYPSWGNHVQIINTHLLCAEPHLQQQSVSRDALERFGQQICQTQLPNLSLLAHVLDTVTHSLIWQHRLHIYSISQLDSRTPTWRNLSKAGLVVRAILIASSALLTFRMKAVYASIRGFLVNWKQIGFKYHMNKFHIYSYKLWIVNLQNLIELFCTKT